jgi:O-antigen/teichoic acid export membrane protein
VNLTRESFNTFIFQISGFICATISQIILARALGPEKRGIVAVVLLHPVFLFTIFNLSIGMGIMHHMGKKNYDAKTFTGSALIMIIIMSFLALSIFFATIATLTETFYKGIEIKYLIFASFSIPFYLMLYYFSSILQGSMDIKGYNISNQILSFSNLFFILVFIILWKFRVFEAVIAGISGIALGGLYSFLRTMKRTKGISFSKGLTGKLIKDGIKVHIGAVATFIFNQANIFILNYYSTPSEVGFYAIALSIANTLFFFSVSLEIGLYPKMAHSNMDDAINLVQVATRQMLLITGLVALIMAIFSKGIVLIYGGRAFLPAVTPLLLLLPGIVVFVIPKILSTLWVRKGWFLPLTFIATGTALLSLIFNFMLIPKFGAKGAAMSTALTYGFSSLIAVFLFWKYIKKDFYMLFIPQKSDFIIYREILTIFKK